jgi:hypothetical protein
MRRSVRVALSLLLMLAAAPAAADALRCDNRLVTTGARVYEVLRACGEPDYREPVRDVFLYGHILLRTEEIWYYNRGPRELIRILRFRDGRLEAVRSGGYGFNPDARAGCRPHDLRAGMSGLELIQRCGEPDHREIRTRTQLRQPERRSPHHVLVTYEEEWTYDFGPAHFDRIAVLVGGTVVRVERGARGY